LLQLSAAYWHNEVVPIQRKKERERVREREKESKAHMAVCYTNVAQNERKMDFQANYLTAQSKADNADNVDNAIATTTTTTSLNSFNFTCTYVCM